MSGIKRRALAEEDRRRHATALSELVARGVDVFCWCNRCGHNSVIPSARIAASLSDDCPVPELGAHLRCIQCGGKDVATRPHWPSLGQVARHR